MKERPIIFSGEMVRAILEGRKTMTRRPIKPQPEGAEQWTAFENQSFYPNRIKSKPSMLHCPYGIPGDRLWVRETWALEKQYDKYSGLKVPAEGRKRIWYLADGPKPEWAGRTRSPRFMPYWAHRIDLENSNVRVERLQEIIEENIIAEGLNSCCPISFTSCPGRYRRDQFQKLWDSLYGNFNLWQFNPWVWVIEFRVVDKNGEKSNQGRK